MSLRNDCKTILYRQTNKLYHSKLRKPGYSMVPLYIVTASKLPTGTDL